jgi:hypothetical protein
MDRHVTPMLSAPVVTTIENIDPKATNAPASTTKTITSAVSRRVFSTPNAFGPHHHFDRKKCIDRVGSVWPIVELFAIRQPGDGLSAMIVFEL